MNVSELSAGQGNVDVEGTIKEIGEVRSFNKFGRELRVANAVLEDSSGSIKLSLWNDDASRFKEGDKVKITNGYVNEFQGDKQLTSGKFGKIEKSDGSDAGQTELGSESTEKVAGGEEGAEESEEGDLDEEAPVEEEVF